MRPLETAMLAPPRPATRGPVLTRRALTRSSLVGVGLLALTSAGMPVALADDGVDPDVASPGTPVDDAAPEALDPAPGADDVTPGASIEGFFGRGKSLGFQVEYDPATAPPELDLSGAVFTLSGTSGTFTCTTESSGYCSVEVSYPWGPMFGLPEAVGTASNAVVPPGTYAVIQTAGPEGLAPASGAGSVQLCFMEQCPEDAFGPVVNDSLFRSPVVGSVVDAVTGDPVEGADYTLTGPDHHVLATEPEETPAVADPGDDAPGDPEPGDEDSGDEDSGDEGAGDEGAGDEGAGDAETPAEPDPAGQGADNAAAGAGNANPGNQGANGGGPRGGRVAAGSAVTSGTAEAEDGADGDTSRQSITATSDADGVLTFDGWFLPGADYVLTPGAVVPGYGPDTVTTGIEIAAATGPRAASLPARRLAPVVVPVSGDPSPPPVDVPPVVTPPVSTPDVQAPVAAGAGSATTSGATLAARARAVPPAATPPAAGPSTPVAPAGSSASRAADRGGDTPAFGDAAQGADQPELDTVSSTLPDKGVIMALGVLFLVIVVVGLGFVRRNARRRG